MKSVYVLLTRTGTIFSKGMRLMVTDEFTHSSISLNRDLTQLFSFARKHHRLMLPAGLVREDVFSGVYGSNPDAPCALLELSVSDEVYSAIARRIYSMVVSAEDYHYSILGVALCYFSIAHSRGRHYFCSQFVADVLHRSGALDLSNTACRSRLDSSPFSRAVNALGGEGIRRGETLPALVRPSDFCAMPEFRLIYKGALSKCTQGGLLETAG